MFWKAVLKAWVIIVAGVISVNGATREVTDEEYSQFPRLFYLDDYDTCMLREDALYCMGVFQISADDHNPIYRLLKEYSDDINNFNRTRLHRGYCVSQRCPLSPPTRLHQSSTINLDSSHCNTTEESQFFSHANNALRFERCVSKWSQKHDLQVTLSSLQYCHTWRDVHDEKKVETPHRMFLGVAALIVMMNVVGTVYDYAWIGKKSRLLTSWSVRSNWRHLVGDFRDGDPRLASILPVEGIRCVVMLSLVLVHNGCIHDMLYLSNPRLMEWMSHSPVMMLLHNGHTVVQLFIVLSSLMLAQDILQGPQPPSIWILPKFLIKRIIRLAPVYLLVLGYAATWWPLSHGGPQWPPLVEAQSATCRNNFWTLAFFIGSSVKSESPCLIQTWYLHVEIQLYVFAILLTLCLARVRRWALHILGGMFVLSVVGTVVIAYVRRLSPFMKIVGPENLRSLFVNEESFTSFYTQPYSNVGGCLAGLLLAHLFRDLRERGFQPAEHKRVITGCQMTLPLMLLWTLGAGNLFRDIESREARVLFLALERPVMSLLFGIVLFGIFNGRSNKIGKTSNTIPARQGGVYLNMGCGKLSVTFCFIILFLVSEKVTSDSTKGYFHHILSWRGLYPLGRVSLAVMMLHWCVNMTFVASRPGLTYSSVLVLLADFLSTASLTYLLAVPVTVLLDIPAQQMFSAVASS